ncbi:MAG TPA: sugar phosphate isomerase/epimerase family protein [Gemmataceae bacterium]|jgi:sugar phosphate isomerase/epimerase|nr:sugar phosphate isomerase/epimerase family protein [Gemmataceae bacterium]
MPVRVSVTVCLIPEAKGGPFVLWDDLEPALRLAADLGYDAVELFPPDPGAFDPAAVRGLLAQHRLAVSAVGSGAGWVRHKLSLTHPDAAHRAKAQAFVRGMIDFAAELGAPVIIGSMQGRWGDGVSRDQALAFLAEGLGALGEYARGRGTVLLYEPLNRYETNLINTIDAGVAFLKTLATPNVKLLADLFHMNIEEADIAGSLRAGGPHIGHIHFADSNRRPAGLGHLDFGPILDAVREMNYDGYFAAEAFPYPTPRDAAKQTIEKFRELFH